MTHSSSATQPIAHRPTGRQPHPPSSKPRHDGTPVKRSPRVVMAEAARQGRLYLGYRNRRGREQSYVSRTLRLALLAPDLDKGIVAGTADQAPVRERLERLPTDWCEQGAIHPRAPDWSRLPTGSSCGRSTASEQYVRNPGTHSEAQASL
jgi:hypothetical protein